MLLLPFFFFSIPVILSSQQPAEESFLANLAPIVKSIHEERGFPMDYAHRKGLSVDEWRQRGRAEVQRYLAYAPKPAPVDVRVHSVAKRDGYEVRTISFAGSAHYRGGRLLAVWDFSGWTALFDGKTLAGWHVAARPEDIDKNFWTVREGAITCDSRGRKDHDYVWLLSDGEYGDFELKLKVRGFASSTGNSGVQVRSRYDRDAFWLDGPQVDIHPPGPWRTGLIYDETRGTRRWLFPSLPDWNIEPRQGPPRWTWEQSGEDDGWNTLEIVCRGTTIRTTVNGIRIADFNGAGILDDGNHRARNVGLRGHIGLQLHSRDEVLIQYKDLFVRALD